jgi:hypothetical protein
VNIKDFKAVISDRQCSIKARLATIVWCGVVSPVFNVMESTLQKVRGYCRDYAHQVAFGDFKTRQAQSKTARMSVE